jgi:hypothetical protein
MLLVLTIKSDMNWCSSVLKIAVIFLQVRATAAKPKVWSAILDAKTTVLSSFVACAFELEFIAKRSENGFVEVAHLNVVFADREGNVTERHDESY